MNPAKRWHAMHPGTRLTVIGAVLIFAGWGAYKVGDGTWSGERGELRSTLNDLESRISTASTRIRQRTKQDEEAASFANRTLGGDAATVDSELRSRLNRLVEELDLAGNAVNTGEMTSRSSPRRSTFNGSGKTKLRNEPDFTEVKATVSGEGSIDKVLQLIYRIQSEPWIKRIDEVSLNPVKDGDTQKVMVRLTTLFIPGMKPDAKAVVAAPDLGPFDQYLALIETNPFRVPAPPKEAAKPVPTPAPPPPTGFPWHEWMVAMVAMGPNGWEVGLRNVVSNETRNLLPGETLADARLIGVEGDSAQFELAEQRFAVVVGNRMSDRVAIVR